MPTSQGGYVHGTELGSGDGSNIPKATMSKRVENPFEFHIHWIDTEEKKRILDNIASGQKSGEPAINIFDQHKLD